MTKEPKISVIIPVYNVERYISRCIESVVGQTLRDIEIICVNDGTKDDSVRVIQQYMERDDRIQLVNKPNGGLSSARNAGLRVATGEVVLFLDSDDYLTQNACERIYEEHLNHNADILVFGSTPFPEIPAPDIWLQWDLSTRDIYYKEFSAAALIDEPGGNPYAWNRAFKRSFLQQNHLEFDETVAFGEDIVFIFKAAPLAHGMQFIHDRLHYYQHYRKNSLMFNAQDQLERKITASIDNLVKIAQYWQQLGLIEKWGEDFTRWSLDFVMAVLLAMREGTRASYAQQILQIMDEYHLTRWVSRTPKESRSKYATLRRMAREA